MPDRAFDGAALLVSVPHGTSLETITARAARRRRDGALLRPRRQPRDPLYGAPPTQSLPRRIAKRDNDRSRPQPRPGVLDIAPYVPGKSSAPGVAKMFKLSSNETPLGPSPQAIAAYRAVRRAFEDYPDGCGGDLRAAIGARLRARSRPASSAAPAPTICSI